MRLIVNADDLGDSAEVNDAIVRLFALGVIDRTSLLVNAAGFTEACRLAKANHFDDRIGLHFNIAEGTAVSTVMADTPRFCTSGGEFRYVRNTGFLLSKHDMNAVAAECNEQLRMICEEGVHPMHVDSHRHIHTEWFIFEAMEPVLRAHGITTVRIAKNIGRTSFPKNAYKTLFNRRLAQSGWETCDYFGSATEVIEHAAFLQQHHASVEVMTHPTLDAHGAIVDACSGEELLPQLERLRRIAHAHSGEYAVK